jgi:hypothetical protein
MPQLELLGRQSAPQTPARFLLGAGDELRAEALSEQAIARRRRLSWSSVDRFRSLT